MIPEATQAAALHFLAAVFGSGGFAVGILMWLGTRRGRAAAAIPAPPPPPPAKVEVESPWLVQNLIQMEVDIEKIRETTNSIVAAMNIQTLKIDLLITHLHRRSRD